MKIDLKTVHEELATVWQPNPPSYRIVAKWTKRSLEERDVIDHPRPNRLVSELTDENVELVPEATNNDPHSTDDDITG